ncbi:MAG TPA: HutD family protein [Beijerinckiaceae bacterium]|jgi:environmental stress-induced protein Ves
MKRLDPALYRSTPWKNGGGTTVDIAGAMRPGFDPGGWDGLVWRLGRTRIEVPGPFSDLSGCDRILTVIKGSGLRLRPAEAPVIDVTRAFAPVRFPGEWRIVSELEAGPVGVLNLIADRDRAAIDLVIQVEPGASTVEGDLAVLYALDGGARFDLAGEAIELPPDGAVEITLGDPVTLTLRSGRLAVASIRLKIP